MSERIEKGICGICGAGCGVSIGLENDRITKILPWKTHPQCIASFFGRGNFEESIWKMFSPNEQGYTIPNSIFMPLGSPNAFSIGTICHLSHAFVAPLTTFGASGGILQPDLEHADIIFVWGANPATGSPLQTFLRLKKASTRIFQTLSSSSRMRKPFCIPMTPDPERSPAVIRYG
ncbi:hypothetical protein [Desulfobacula sp.]|uniref:hypothetical protein n=1 Tax=Desulfobacula sp. TaxID=2593537 RepID=UPI0026264948|nr:hypothetical protein [Desulfobacula sp.]